MVKMILLTESAPYLLPVQRDDHVRDDRGQTPLAAMPPGLQQLLLALQPLPLLLHVPLALPEPLQALLVLLQLFIQLLPLAPQPLSLQVAPPLSLFQPALQLPPLALPGLALALPALPLLPQLLLEPLDGRHLLLLLFQVPLLLLLLQRAAADARQVLALGAGGRAAALLEEEPLNLVAAVLDGDRRLARKQRRRLAFEQRQKMQKTQLQVQNLIVASRPWEI